MSHRSFLLRCLPVRRAAGRPGWRFSIQEATPEAPRHAFDTIAEMLAFLDAELNLVRPESAGDDSGATGQAEGWGQEDRSSPRPR